MIEHGQYKFDWQGDILVLSLQGGFNEVAIKNFFGQVTDSILVRQKPHWVLLSNVDSSMLGSPEVIGIIKSAYSWGIRKGCIAAAISGANLVVEDIFSNYFKTLAIPTALFAHQEDALQWLQRKLDEA